MKQSCINKFLFVWLCVLTLVFGRVTYQWVAASGLWYEQAAAHQKAMQEWQESQSSIQIQKQSFLEMEWLKDFAKMEIPGLYVIPFILGVFWMGRAYLKKDKQYEELVKSVLALSERYASLHMLNRGSQ